jgi:hypothetical protein
MIRNAALLLIMSLTGAGGSAPAGQERPLLPRDEKATKCGRRGGRESERLILPVTWGNRPEGPR